MWLLDSGDPGYDDAFDVVDDNVIDLKDFAVLAASWDLPSSEESDWYYLHDALGSVIGIVGARFGRESDRQFILYDAYGQPDTLPANSNPYLFTGRRYDRVDDDQILYYLRARHYGPLTGRFLQTDPIGYIDGMNPYEYVRSRPTMKSDPWGLAALHWTPGGVGFPTEYRQIQLSSPASTLRNKILGRTLLRSGRGLLLPLNIYNRFRKNYTIEDELGEWGCEGLRGRGQGQAHDSTGSTQSGMGKGMGEFVRLLPALGPRIILREICKLIDYVVRCY